MTNAATMALVTKEPPKGLKKLTAPPLLKLEHIPIGQAVSGVILALAPSLSKRADMVNSKLIHLRHESGSEFLVPLSGTIKNAVGGEKGVEDRIGKRLVLVRQPDGETTKYGGKKKMFMIDVYCEEK